MSTQKTETAVLPFSTLDPDSPAPLYHQIEADLRRMLRTGALPPGAPLPPETELSRLYGVGRQTVRLALARLVEDDLIERQAGRGTFVKPQTERIDFYLDRSFTRQMADMGLTARSQVLAQSTGIVDETLPSSFNAHLGEPYFQLMRLRFGDGEPIGLQSSRVLLQLCPGLEAYDFTTASLYEVLFKEYQLAIRRIEHTIRAAAADELQAGLLQVGRGDPLLLVRSRAFLDNDQIMEETVSYYRADKYEYRTMHAYSP